MEPQFILSATDWDKLSDAVAWAGIGLSDTPSMKAQAEKARETAFEILRKAKIQFTERAA